MNRVSAKLTDFFNRLLDIPTVAPDERRRARLLNIILLGFTLISFVAIALVLAGQIAGYYSQQGANETYIPTLIILVGMSILYVINRYWSGRLASGLFLLFLTTILYFFHLQRATVWNNNALTLAIPILMASLILSPRASLVMAGIVSTIYLGASAAVDGKPNFIGMIAYFTIAFVAWLSARRLEQTVNDLHILNSALDELVEQRTTELGQTNVQLRQELMQREIFETELRLSDEILRQMPDAIFVTNLEGQVERWLGNAQEMFGYAAAEAVGQYARFIHHPSLGQDKSDEIIRSVQENGRYVGEILCVRKDGSEVPIEATVQEIKSPINQSWARISINRDISQRKQAERALQQAYAELEERVRERTTELAQANEQLQQEISERAQIEQKLEQERNILRTLIDTLPHAIYVKDMQSRFITCNTRQAYLAGVDSHEELIGRTDLDLFPEHGAAYYADEQTVIHTGQPILNKEEPIGEKIGSQRWHLTSKVPLRDKEGNVIGLVGVGHDITERKRTEETLRTHSQILYSMAEGVAFVDAEGVIRYTNPSYEHMFGYSSGELIGQHVSTLNAFPPEIHSRVVNEVLTALERGQMWEGEFTDRKKDGTVIYTHARISPFEYRGETWSVTVEENITERKEAERQLKTSLREKEILLKEIHHRVKNNLQVISSLLDLQSTYVESEAVQEMFQESRTRVRSMALVHEQLYQSTDLAHINFADYVHDLTGYLLRAYGTSARNVTLTIDIASTTLSVETAVPLGLIINELVSNAYKHAFPDGRSGRITIQLVQIEDHEMNLIVQDDGIGFPKDIDFRRSPSLGLTIIMTLVDQLRGQIELDRQNGARFELIIPLDSGLLSDRSG